MSAYSDLILGESGLVGYWRLGEGSGSLIDASANSNDGTAVNSPTYGATGLLVGDADTALDFENGSTQYVSVADHATLDCGDTFSWECWIKPESYSGGVLACKGSNSFYVAFNGSGNIRLGKTSVGDICASTTTIGTGTTAHVVCTKNGATSKIYINGVDVTGSVTDRTISNTAIALFIAAFVAGLEATYDGVMDEVAYYNVALSQAQVTAHYNAGQGIFGAADQLVNGGLVNRGLVNGGRVN